MSQSMKILLVVGFMAVILWNLGSGLYYMMTDKGRTNRTVKALTRRIAFSVALILIVIFSAWMGWIELHGVGSNPDTSSDTSLDAQPAPAAPTMP